MTAPHATRSLPTTTSAPTARGIELLDAFRELYAEATREARALTRPEPPDADAVKHRLLAILARQTEEARERLADHEIVELGEAQYVMVAMADEAFLSHPWAGRDAWAGHPLESERPFQSHVAGEKIFVRLDEILAGRATVSSALLGVYLAALALGFRGRYRYDPASAEPERYRRELVRYLRRVEPEVAQPCEEICPDALAAVGDQERRRGLRGLREGLLPVLLAMAVMMVLGHGLWVVRTLSVREELDRVEDARAEMERRALQREKARRAEGPEVSAR
jgi:type VI secretion system protein ImpK